MYRYFFFLSLFSYPMVWAHAETPSIDSITHALQSEYQLQLKNTQPQSARVLPKKNLAVRKVQPKKVQQVRRTPQPAPRPTPKAPIPNAASLFSAATNGSVNTIARLLKQGANINSANHDRETALHMAAARGHYSAVIYLINHGANLHARTVRSWLPLHHATRFRHANIANYLVQRGSSPHARTSDGISAIDMAKTVRDQRLLSIFGAR